MVKDLTQKKDTYAYQLCRMQPSYVDLLDDPNYSACKMAKHIAAAVCQAKDTPARKRFLSSLELCMSKLDMYCLCQRAVERASSYVV